MIKRELEEQITKVSNLLCGYNNREMDTTKVSDDDKSLEKENVNEIKCELEKDNVKKRVLKKK